MTRLADALERANRASDPAPQDAPAPAPAAAPQHHRHGHSRRLQPAPTVAARAAVRTAPPDSAQASGTPLLGMPRDGDKCTAWRDDPQLVGKLLGTEGF